MMNPSSSAPDVLRLVSQFFDKEWPVVRADDVRITKMTDGYSSLVHLISREAVDGSSSGEPESLIIRNYGSHCVPEIGKLTDSEEAVISYEMSRRGWGARLFGIFPGGRVEEHIKSHTLTPAESMDPAVCRDVARSYARVHSLHLPFHRDGLDVSIDNIIKGIEILCREKDQRIANIRAINHRDALFVSETIFNQDWVAEWKWIKSLLSQHACKRTLMLMDTNFLNVLVKEYESECGIVLIDYEMAKKGYRAVDIGGHFVSRMFSWSDGADKRSGFAYPRREERQLFCDYYLQEMGELGQNLTAGDTIHQLLLESDIGSLFTAAWIIFFVLKLEVYHYELSFITALCQALELYRARKEELMKNIGSHD